MGETSLAGVPLKLEAAGDTHIGGRSHNEDAFLIRPDLDVFLVADGAGGQDAGNIASSLAATTIAHFFEQARPRLDELPALDDLGLSIAARRLSAAVQEANREIISIAKSSQRHHGMGSTVVATLFVPRYRQVHVAHVGDSRVYRLRDAHLEQLTVDHSLLNDVMELQPQIDNARIRKLPRNVVTRALGMAEGVRVSIRSYEVVHGDRYLLCSDGISDVISSEQLREALMLDASCEDCSGLLIEMALAAKAADNIAAVVIDVKLPGRRKTKSRPRMERYGMTAEPARGVSQSQVTPGSVPGVVVYGDSGPDHPDAQPGIQVTTHEMYEDDFEFDDEIVEDGSEVPSSSPILPPAPMFDAPPARPQEEQRDRATQRSPSSNPMAPAMPRFRAARGSESPGAGRYTYVGSPSAERVRRRSGPAPGALPPEEHRSTRVGPPPLPRTPAPSFSQPRRHKERPAAEAARRTGETSPPATDLMTAQQRVVRKSRPPMPMPLQSNERMFRKPMRAAPRDAPIARAPTPPPLEAFSPAPVPRDSPIARAPTPPPLEAFSPGPARAPAARTPLAFDQLQARASDPEPPKDKREMKSLPPMRTPFETGEFMPDGSVVCHACGSVINSHAELCLYCGAKTGFLGP